MGSILFRNWRGAPQDLVSAHMWLNLAAAQGVEKARTTRNIVAGLLILHQIAVT